jgi:hypothetical protein
MATKTLKETLTFQLLTDLQKTDAGVTLQPRPVTTKSDVLTDGTDADEANKVYGPVRRTLAGGANEELDLSGSLTDIFGDTVVLTKVKGLLIHNTKTDVGAKLEIGGSAANAFLLFKAANDIYTLGPNGIFFVWEPSLAGLTVTAGTGDLLKINNVSSPSVSIDYDIVVVGVG